MAGKKLILMISTILSHMNTNKNGFCNANLFMCVHGLTDVNDI
jgi:hypothetical protein